MEKSSRMMRGLNSEKTYVMVLMVLHLIFFAGQFLMKNHLVLSDSRQYSQAADNLLERGVFYAAEPEAMETRKEFHTKRTVLYPAFIAFFRFFGMGDRVILIFQNILSLFTFVMLRRILLERGFSREYAWTLLVLALFSPAVFIYSNLVMSEILLGFFLFSGFYCLVKHHDDGRLGWWTGYALFLILAMLTKPVMYLFAFVNLALTLAFFRKRYHILVSILPVLAVFLYSYWNYTMTGHFSYSSIQTINLVNYNTYYFNINRLGKEKADSILKSVKAKAEEKENYHEKQKLFLKEGMKSIMDSPARYFLFHVKGMAGFFLDPGRFDFFTYWDLNRPGEKGLLYHLNAEGIKGCIRYLWNMPLGFLIYLGLVFVFHFLRLVAFLLFSTLLAKRNVKRFFPAFYAVLITAYVAFATGPLGASRFSLPVFPFLMGIEAYVLAWVLDKWKNSGSREKSSAPDVEPSLKKHAKRTEQE